MGYSTGVDVGTGLTLTWNSTTFVMEILGLTADGEETPIIDVTHMLSTTSRAFIGGDLRDDGSVDIECHCQTDQMNHIRAGSTGTVSVTAPAGATTKNITGGWICQSRNYAIPLEDKMTIGYTMKWAGIAVMPTS